MAQTAETVGELRGTIGETAGEWQTLRMAGFGATANFDSFIPGFTSFTIQGHKDSRLIFENSLSVTFVRRDDGSILEPSVLYFPTQSTVNFMESAERAVQIELDEFTVQDSSARISGRVTGTIRPVSISGIDITDDPDGAVPVNITFSTTAYPAE
jgi:hypothetical protein